MFRPLLSLFASATSAIAAEPNVIFITVDDLRPDLGAYGESHMVTPHMDALDATDLGCTSLQLRFRLTDPSDPALLPPRSSGWCRAVKRASHAVVLIRLPLIPEEPAQRIRHQRMDLGVVNHRGRARGCREAMASHFPEASAFPRTVCPLSDFQLAPDKINCKTLWNGL